MGEITFGEDFGMLASRTTKGDLVRQRRALAFLAPFDDASWIARLGISFFPFLPAVKDYLAATRFCCERMQKRMTVRPESSSNLLIRSLCP